MSTPAILYQSALSTDCKPVGPPRKTFPLPQNSPIQLAAYELEQDFEMRLTGNTFPPAQKNSPSTFKVGAVFVFGGLADVNAILTNITPPTPTGAGKGRFTCRFTIVPASWDDFQTSNVMFPGWINTVASGLSRAAKTRNVTLRVRNDYFVLDPANLAAGVLDSGGAAITRVASEGAIPTISSNVWLSTLGGVAQPNSDDNDLVPAGGVTVGTATYQPTFPSLDIYRQWCAVATAFLGTAATWDATHPPAWDGASTAATFGQFIMSNSKLITHAGNIICRATPYALFQ